MVSRSRIHETFGMVRRKEEKVSLIRSSGREEGAKPKTPKIIG